MFARNRLHKTNNGYGNESNHQEEKSKFVCQPFQLHRKYIKSELSTNWNRASQSEEYLTTICDLVILMIQIHQVIAIENSIETTYKGEHSCPLEWTITYTKSWNSRSNGVPICQMCSNSMTYVALVFNSSISYKKNVRNWIFHTW